MFQYALHLMAKKYNTDFCIPPNEIFGKYYYQKLFSNIDDLFDIDCRREIGGPYPDVNERFFHYDGELG